MRTERNDPLHWQRLVLALVMMVSGAFALPAASHPADDATRVRLNNTYGRLPLAFEVSAGQAPNPFGFLARGQGYSLFLTPCEAVLSLRGDAPAVVRMHLAGANDAPHLAGMDRLPGTSNYFIGNDPKRWRTALPTYAKVKYSGVYPGIDLIYYGDQRQLEYDFIVAPGADPTRIVLDFKGVTRLSLDAAGELVVATAGGEIRQHKPAIYQEIEGVRRLIDGRYVLHGKRRVSFEVAAYDRTKALVIDPVLAYSTYLGGRGHDRAISVALDDSGSAYVAGLTASSDFPTTPGAHKTSFAGGNDDAFITKLNASGTALVYSTYLGGSSSEQAWAIAVDGSGNAYVAGFTASSDFPTTPVAFQTTYGGQGNAFVTKLNASGTALMYSTYLGGSGIDSAIDIALDGNRNTYVTGRTTSTNFPTTPGALQTAFGGGLSDAFVAKLNAAGTALVYSTFLGGSGDDFGHGIALDAGGNAYVAGPTGSSNFPTTPGAYQVRYGGGPYDAFVAKLNASGTGLIYSTFLGSGGDDEALDVAVDNSGNAYITGATSGNFPTTVGAYQTTYGGGAFDAFVTKLNAAGTALVYSTFLGGSGDEGGVAGIAVDNNGNVYVTGGTSGDFPTTAGAFQTTFAGGARADGFLTQVNADGTALLYSTYLGGDRDDWPLGIAVDGGGNVYVAGFTASSNFPTTADAYQSSSDGNADGFVVKFSGLPTGPSATTVDVVEFYDANRDHYFISSLQPDINALDSGAFPGWTRTGLTFKAYAQPTGNTSPVCRFYIPPAYGDSHFYSASLVECAQVAVKWPYFIYESPSVMHIDPPDPTMGTCPPRDVPVYRVYDNRVDTNHRYTTDRNVRGQMVSKGWIAEGYGPDQVIMCAPQ